ncbi:8023_t:CDS:2 [Funneliformis geosporum]|nr:8023_t:CDS:2 [Funneliformis geosporum]
MVKEIIIPKENKVPIEEVRELENQAKNQSELVKLVTFLGLSRVECVKDKTSGSGGGVSAGGVGGASSKKENLKGSGSGSAKRDPDWEPKIVHVDTVKEARQHNADEFRKMERDATEGDCKILGEITLPKTHELYFSAKEKYLSFDEEARTEAASNGQFKPNDKELELLEEGCTEVLAAFDSHFKQELLTYQTKPYTIHHAEVKEKISQIRKLIHKPP